MTVAGEAEPQAPAAGASGAPEVVLCPACGAAAATGEDVLYCEDCGGPLPVAATAEGAAADGPADPDPGAPAATSASAPSGPCAACGSAVAADGYCEVCGAKAGVPRDHVVQEPAPWVVGVSDRGIRHSRNEDAVAVGVVARAAALVVCDGVTTAPNSDVASAAGVEAALQVMLDGLAEVTAPSTSPALDDDGAFEPLAELMRSATAAAAEVVARTVVPEDEASSCTFVATIVVPPLLVAGSVGDSRAYWIPDTGEAQLLTVDDSWATELLARGMSREEAETAYGAHAITRWLGSDSPDTVPRLGRVLVDVPGWVLVCSDGLWNYCSEPTDLGALLQQAVAAAAGETQNPLTPLDLAEALVGFANGRGGHDNITVALARIDPAPRSHPDDAQHPGA